MNQKKLLSMLGLAASVGSLSASEFRSPLTSVEGPMRYDMLAKKNKWSFDTWSMALARSAERSFRKHDVKTKELPTVFFDQENFTMSQAFGSGLTNVPSSNMNINTNATRFFPVASYSELSVILGGRFEYPVWDNRGRIGVRASVPFRTVRVERDNDAERSEAGSSEVHVAERQTTVTYIGSDGTRVVRSGVVPGKVPTEFNALSPLAIRTAALNIPFVTNGVAAPFISVTADGTNLVIGGVEQQQQFTLAGREAALAGNVPYSFIKLADGQLPGNTAVPVYVLLNNLLETEPIAFQAPVGANVGTSPAARLVKKATDLPGVFDLIDPAKYTDAGNNKIATAPGSSLIKVAATGPTIRFLENAADAGTITAGAFDPNGILSNALGVAGGSDNYETFSAVLGTFGLPAEHYRNLSTAAVDRATGAVADIATSLAISPAGAAPTEHDIPGQAVLAAATNVLNGFGGLQQLPANLDDMQPNTVYMPAAGQGALATQLLARTDVWMVENRRSDNVFSNNVVAAPGAATPYTILSDRAVNGINRYGALSAEQWLNGCDILLRTDQETGLGDIDVDLFYEHTFNDDWRGEVVLGVRLPTGGDKNFCNNPYKVKLGNGNHAEIKVGGMAMWQAFDWMNLKATASYSFALRAKEKIVAPLQGATLKGIGTCVNAHVDWGYFLGRLTAQFYHPKTDRLATSFGYEFYFKTKDSVCLKDTTTDLTCLFGQALNATDATKITQAVLDRAVAERHTERIAHRFRAESNFRLNQYFSFYLGGAYTFAGQNIPRESDLYAGTSVRF